MDVALLLLRNHPAGGATGGAAGGGERRRFKLSYDVLTIGRGQGCDMRIPLGDVSRKHCTIVQTDGQLLVQDLGSSNGTYVNGKRIQETPLRAGDQIRIGSLRFVVQIDGKPTEDEAFSSPTLVEQTAPETPTPAEHAVEQSFALVPETDEPEAAEPAEAAEPEAKPAAKPAAKLAAASSRADENAEGGPRKPVRDDGLIDVFQEDDADDWP